MNGIGIPWRWLVFCRLWDLYLDDDYEPVGPWTGKVRESSFDDNGFRT